MPQPTVLCYDPAGSAYLAKLPALCAVQGLRLRRLTAGQLDRLLAALQKAGVPRTCLKAVLTPTNAQWTLRALYQELCRERERLG